MNGKITITVPLVPPSPNVLKRKYRNPHAYKRLRDTWESMIFYCTPLAERTLLTGWAASAQYKIRIRITMHHVGSARDPDNLPGSQKIVLDALKNQHFLHDDSGEWIDLLKPGEEPCNSPKEQRTVIEIEPIWEESA
jgi:hypothetical protein